MTSVLFPTTGRPDRAERCLRQLRETTKEHDVEIVAAVDADPETARVIGGLVDTLIYAPHYRGCSAAWNSCLAESNGDPVVLAADDLVWREGWLEAALIELYDFEDGWGLVGFNDGNMSDEGGPWGPLSTHYLMSRRFVVEVLGGVVAWDCYRHSFNDVEANERARAAGRYKWCEEARVEHEHWVFGSRAQDHTDRRSLDDHPASEAAFIGRRKRGFPNEYDAVITE